MAKATYAKKAFVSLLPRGQWVCDKSRAFRVRKRKKKRMYLMYLICSLALVMKICEILNICG